MGRFWIKILVLAEIVINAGGLWAREVGKLAGINLPVQPMEHHYLITETIPEIKERVNEPRLPIGTDFEGNIYFRQEGKGMLLGTYEPKSTPWKVKGPLTIFLIPARSSAGILSKPIASLSSILSNFGSSNSWPKFIGNIHRDQPYLYQKRQFHHFGLLYYYFLASKD